MMNSSVYSDSKLRSAKLTENTNDKKQMYKVQSEKLAMSFELEKILAKH